MQPSPAYSELPESDAPLLELVAPEAPPEVVAATEAPPAGPFNTLYQSFGGTLTAVALGLLIIVGIQIIVGRIFKLYREEHRALTAFATSMVGLVVGIYVCDMLIAGPTAELLSEGERLSILSFVKDTALMVFAYYFGTKAQVPTDLPRE